MRLLEKPSVLVAALLLCTLPLTAQDWRGRGRMQGVVKDEQGNPVANAKVTLRAGKDRVDPAAPGPATITTDKSGKFAILGLAGGPWGILIEADGYNGSEGQLAVNEFAPAPPLTIVLKKPSQEVAKAKQAASKAELANEAIGKADALLKDQKFAEARAEYQKAVELTDVQYHPPFLRAIARTYFAEGQAAKSKEEKTQKVNLAVNTLKQADQLKPGDPDTLQPLVDLLVDNGREAEAKTYMAQLPAGSKVAPDTLLNIGIREYNEKHLDAALAQFSKVIEQNPELPDAYYYRGLVYLNMNKVPQAKADFKKLLELDPNHKYAKEAKDYLNAL
jgi:tetratricopeptide (TPR) repeat protein